MQRNKVSSNKIKKEDEFMNEPISNNDISSGESFYYEKLNADIDPTAALRNPIFFVPTTKDTNLLVPFEFEPFSSSVKDNMELYAKFNTDERAMYNYLQYLIGQEYNISMSNINIILNDEFMNYVFSKTIDQYRDNITEIYMKSSIFNRNELSEVLHRIITDGLIDSKTDTPYVSYKAMMTTLPEVLAYYSNGIANWLYSFINSIIVKEYVDIDSIASDVLNVKDVRSVAGLDSTSFSISFQGLLEIANRCIYKISEIVEISMVRLHYNFINYLNNNGYIVKQIEEKN